MKKICLLFALMVSCTSNGAEKDTLYVALPIEATGLYPYQANDPHSSRVNVLLYDTLITHNTNREIVPVIAQSWNFVDQVTIDFVIRTNIQFHNGDFLTLEDVQYSYEQILQSPNLAHTVEPIKSTEITADGKFRVNLKRPYAPILSLLTYPSFKVVNKKFVEENKMNLSQSPMGTGPYKLKTWNRGQNIILERNELYWGEAPKMKYLDMRTISDSVSRAIALETGDVDLAYDIEGADVERLADHPSIKLVTHEIPRVEYISMNIGKGSNPLWKDKRARQAFAYAIDLNGIVNSVLFGVGRVANSLLPSVVSGYDFDLPERRRDLEKAKALLHEMGVTNATMTMWVREGLSQKIGEVIQANLREIGIDVNLETIEYARFLEGIANGDHDTFILNWSTITADADYGLNNLLNSKAWGSKGNRSFYSNEEIDKLLEQGRILTNVGERTKVYKKIQELVFEDVPYIPLYYYSISVGMNKNVQGFVYDMFSDYRLDAVYYNANLEK